jgi:general secretion pathway protein D
MLWLAGPLVLLLAAPAVAQAPPIRARPKPGVLKLPTAKKPAVRTPPQKKPAAAAQPPAAPALPGQAGPLPTTMDAIAKAADTPYRPKPAGFRVKFNLQDADLAELVNHISGMTGKRFIYGSKVRNIKATVVSPSPVTLAEAYQAFLSILDANGMTVVPHGRFLKIVDSGGIVTQDTPIYSRGAPVPNEDRFITRLYRLRNVDAQEVAQLLSKFKSKEGDISVYAPGQLLILTDTGANIQRMIRIIEEVDVGGASNKMWIEPVHYGAADDLAKRINELFDLGQNGKPGANGANGAPGAGGLVKVVPDDQSNSLIIVGQPDSYKKLLELMKRLDSKPAAEGKVHVLPLQNAVADELAKTLTQMLNGAQKGGKPGQPGGAGELFDGQVQVTADKATNSLIITSSGRDYAQMRLVVDELDMRRRQVFIEAVIMDVGVDHSTSLGVAFHGGTTANIGGGGDTLFLGGFDAAKSTTFPINQDALQGAALGARGPDLPGTSQLLGTGLSIPAFGVVLNAVASNSDSNVLATPHIIATNNVPAEINVGENIPLQTNVGGGLSNLGALAGAAGAQGANLGALGGLGALGLGGYSAPHQDVGTKIKVTPHINSKNQVRLEIEEEISNPGAAVGALGAVPITKRTAKTTVVVDDQQTVVIGGLMRDSVVKTRTKVPVLGDLPVLGFLFRKTEKQTRKTNLLLILTPYVIQSQNDLRKIFERKMEERQEFLDRYFVFDNNEWTPPKDWTRTNGLVEDIRQSYFKVQERQRLEEESKPSEAFEHTPSEPIDLPTNVKSGNNPTLQAPRPAPRPRQIRRRPTPRTPPVRRRPTGQLESPIRINPVSRSVNVERME